jgi:S1-C subfamily serine protease
MVMTGGPLIDSGGNFVGMNFYSMHRTPLLPSNKIVDFLVLKCVIKSGPEKTLKRKYESPRSKIENDSPEQILKSISEKPAKIENDSPEQILKSISEKPASLLPSSEGTSSGESESEECVEFCFFPDFDEPLPVNEFTELIRNDLKPRGYPMPTRLGEFVEDTWCKLSKKVASDTSRSVVSLASFKEDQRFFVCTGVFIDCIESTSRILTSASLIRSSPDENNIADNLKVSTTYNYYVLILFVFFLTNIG